MKSKTIYHRALKTAALLTLLLAAWKCQAQDFRLETTLGLVTFCQSGDPDEICFSFGVQAGELKVQHLGKTAKDLPGRVAAAARMADDAGVSYAVFLRENQIEDSAGIREYYADCVRLRRQFLHVMPELALQIIIHTTQNFQQ